MSTPSLRGLLAREPGRSPTEPFVAGRDGPAPVLAAMAAEGLLVPVAGGVHLPADLADLPQARAAALAAVVPAGGAVTAGAALWARGLLARCPAVDVVLPPRALGGSRPPTPGLRLRGAVLGVQDVEERAGLRLAVLPRAAADAARWAADADAVRLVLLALRAGCSADAVLAVLQHPGRVPGARRAREVLAAALALSALPAPRQPVDVEDAVDAPHGREHVVEVGRVGHLEGEPGDRDAVP